MACSWRAPWRFPVLFDSRLPCLVRFLAGHHGLVGTGLVSSRTPQDAYQRARWAAGRHVRTDPTKLFRVSDDLPWRPKRQGFDISNCTAIIESPCE